MWYSQISPGEACSAPLAIATADGTFHVVVDDVRFASDERSDDRSAADDSHDHFGGLASTVVTINSMDLHAHGTLGCALAPSVRAMGVSFGQRVHSGGADATRVRHASDAFRPYGVDTSTHSATDRSGMCALMCVRHDSAAVAAEARCEARTRSRGAETTNTTHFGPGESSVHDTDHGDRTALGSNADADSDDDSVEEENIGGGSLASAGSRAVGHLRLVSFHSPFTVSNRLATGVNVRIHAADSAAGSVPAPASHSASVLGMSVGAAASGINSSGIGILARDNLLARSARGVHVARGRRLRWHGDAWREPLAISLRLPGFGWSPALMIGKAPEPGSGSGADLTVEGIVPSSQAVTAWLPCTDAGGSVLWLGVEVCLLAH